MKTQMNWRLGLGWSLSIGLILNFASLLAPTFVPAFIVSPASVFAQADDKGDAEFQVSSIEEFAKIPGVIKRPSGLMIKIIHNGDGGIADPNRAIEVHYEGRLADGTVFDSSYSRGGPAKFKMDAVIEGWKEAVMLMRVGSKWEVAIPYSIAYGEDSFGPIPAKADLFFTLELLGVE